MAGSGQGLKLQGPHSDKRHPRERSGEPDPSPWGPSVVCLCKEHVSLVVRIVSKWLFIQAARKGPHWPSGRLR